MHQPLVSILIINWNGLSYTHKCIQSLLKTNYSNIEIILLDNDSDNNEGEVLLNKFKGKLRLLRSSKNIGYARGMNMAYAKARGKYVLLVNNDMIFEKSWLGRLVMVMESDKKIGACQPKIKDIKNVKLFEYAAAAGGFIDVLGYPFARGRIFSKVEEDTGQYDQQIQVCWSGVILLRKQLIARISLFDPIYENYAEDVDMCMRIWGSGYKIVFVPESVAYHFGGAAMNKDMAKKIFYIHRNHMILIIKNWSLRRLLIVLPIRIFLDFITIFYYLISGYGNMSLSVLKAYISLIIKIPDIMRSRKKALKLINPVFFSRMPVYRGSIVWNYFILHKQKYFEFMP